MQHLGHLRGRVSAPTRPCHPQRRRNAVRREESILTRASAQPAKQINRKPVVRAHQVSNHRRSGTPRTLVRPRHPCNKQCQNEGKIWRPRAPPRLKDSLHSVLTPFIGSSLHHSPFHNGQYSLGFALSPADRVAIALCVAKLMLYVVECTEPSQYAAFQIPGCA